MPSIYKNSAKHGPKIVVFLSRDHTDWLPLIFGQSVQVRFMFVAVRSS
jgi:hypothetical protein